MTISLSTLTTKEKIDSGTALLTRLKKSGSMFNLSDAEFLLSENILAVIEKEAVEGIEIINASSDDYRMGIVDANISPGLHISHLRFKKPVNISNSIMKGPVVFRDVIFEKGLYFQYNHVNSRANFEHVDILHNALFAHNLFKGNFSMSWCSVPLQKPGFKYSQFQDDATILGNSFPLGLDLSNCQFQKDLQIILNNIEQTLDLSDTLISGKLVVAGTIDGSKRQQIDEFKFNDLIVNGQFQLYATTIKKKTSGIRAKFKSGVYVNFVEFLGEKNMFAANSFDQFVEFTNNKILRNLSFSHSVFQGALAMQDNVFENAELYFTGCHINDNASIGRRQGEKKICFKGRLIFLGATISSNSILRLFGFNDDKTREGEILFNEALIKGLLDIRHVYIKHISFEDTVVPGNVQDNGSIVSAVKDRSTARLLKNESRKINNQIAGLVYYRCEVKAHAKILTWKQLDDRLLLALNRISNNYGTSWSRGVLFTILSGLLCYCLFYFVRNNGYLIFDRNDFWAGFINYVWLPSGLQGLINDSNQVNGGWAGAIIFILGKVIIAYGVYQTVAAFRKYL